MVPPTGTTRVAAVIGDPIGHSRSPQILNAAFAATGLDWVYVAFEVVEGRAEAALEAMRTLTLAGLSVTMPHKTAVADRLEAVPWGDLSETARRLQAVNCVIADGDRLVGHNTDGPGFVASLGRRRRVRRSPVVDAASWGPGARRGHWCWDWPTPARPRWWWSTAPPSRAAGAAALAGAIGRVGEPSDLADLDLVVNATSLGMDGRSMPVEARCLAPGQLVADIVMSPLDTPLLQAARARGAATLDGLGMLVRQAAVAFELWTGPPRPRRGHGQRRSRALDSQKALYSGVQPADGEAFIPFSEVIVALQGTLETFALPDVLRLLASTHKTGRLRLTGANGSGSLWLDGGAIVSSEAARAPLADGPTDVLFELLRFKEGDFVFDDDATADAPGSPTEVEDALAAAEAMLEEWKSIEAVVPSLAAWVSLRPELPDDDVTVDAAHWRQMVAVGGGITVAGLGDQLGLAELPISRAVKDLVELGLVELGEASAGRVRSGSRTAGRGRGGRALLRRCRFGHHLRRGDPRRRGPAADRGGRRRLVG